MFEAISKSRSSHQQHACARQNFLVPPQDRYLFGSLLEALGGFYVGVELGVQVRTYDKAQLACMQQSRILRISTR
jgi:hypothetical protein